MSIYGLLVDWMQCACYVWPIVRGEPVGTCGYCGMPPAYPAARPEDGRAYRLPTLEEGT